MVELEVLLNASTACDAMAEACSFGLAISLSMSKSATSFILPCFIKLSIYFPIQMSRDTDLSETFIGIAYKSLTFLAILFVLSAIGERKSWFTRVSTLRDNSSKPPASRVITPCPSSPISILDLSTNSRLASVGIKRCPIACRNAEGWSLLTRA